MDSTDGPEYTETTSVTLYHYIIQIISPRYSQIKHVIKQDLHGVSKTSRNYTALRFLIGRYRVDDGSLWNSPKLTQDHGDDVKQIQLIIDRLGENFEENA